MDLITQICTQNSEVFVGSLNVKYAYNNSKIIIFRNHTVVIFIS